MMLKDEDFCQIRSELPWSHRPIYFVAFMPLSQLVLVKSHTGNNRVLLRILLIHVSLGTNFPIMRASEARAMKIV